MAEVRARVLAAAADMPAVQWDACAGPDNPFTRHAFIAALEASGSAVARTGWQAAHIVVDDAEGVPMGILPAYVKSHSQGEYVFDHGWGDAYERAGGLY
jgi:predicted N-acyltransferase